MYLETAVSFSASSGATVSTAESNSLKKLLMDSISLLLIVSALNISYVYIKYLSNKKLPFFVRFVKFCNIEFIFF